MGLLTTDGRTLSALPLVLTESSIRHAAPPNHRSDNQQGRGRQGRRDQAYPQQRWTATASTAYAAPATTTAGSRPTWQRRGCLIEPCRSPTPGPPPSVITDRGDLLVSSASLARTPTVTVQDALEVLPTDAAASHCLRSPSLTSSSPSRCLRASILLLEPPADPRGTAPAGDTRENVRESRHQA